MFVTVGAKIDGFEKAMGTVGQRLRAIDRDVNKTFGGFDKIGDKLSTIGQSLTVGLTLPLAAIGGAATKMAADFDLGLRKVGSLVGGFTDGEMKRLTDQTLAVSRALGIDAVKATDALYEAISAGVPKDNAVDFLAVASKAAIAGVTDTKVAVDGLTSIINAYGLKTSDAKEISDAMFQAVNIGKFQFQDLASAIAIATPLASSLGIGFKEVLAAGATLTSQGFSISEALTSVRSAMTAIISPNKAMQAVLDQTGYSTGEALLKAKGFQGALETLREATGGSVSALTDAYGRVEALGAGLKLTGEFAAKAHADIDSVKNSSQGLGAATAAYNEINKSATRQFEMAVTAIKATAIELGVALLPAVNQLLQASQPLIAMLTDAVKWFGALPPSVQTTILGFTAAAAVIGPMAMALGTLVSTVAQVSAAFTSLASISGVTLSGALGALEMALTRIVPAAAAVAAAFVVFEGLKEIAANAQKVHEELGGLYEVVGSVGKAIIGLYGMALKPFNDTLGLTGETLKPVAEWFGKLDLAALSASKRLHAVSLPLGVANDLLKELHKWLQLVNGKTYDTIDAQEAMRKALNVNSQAMRKQGDEAAQIKQRTDQTTTATKAFEQAVKNTSGALADHTIKTRHAKDLVKEFGDGIPSAIVAEYERRIKAARTEIAKATIDHQLAVLAGKDWNAQLEANIKSASELSDSLTKLRTDALAKYVTDLGKAGDSTAMLSGQIQDMARIGKEQFGTVTTASKEAAEKQTGHWKDFSKDVSTVFTNFAQTIAKSLFDGDLSFGEKAKKMLVSLGEAVTAKFIEPATKAIGDFISGVLSDLMSGKGLGGVLDRIKDIGEGIGKIFGIGADTASTAAGAAGTATNAGGSAAGSAGSAAGSGIAGIVGAIGSVVSAVSGIIGNFQMAKQETTLNAIEESTRYVKIWTGEQSQNMLWCLQTMTERSGYMVTALDAIGRFASQQLGWLERIGMAVEGGAGSGVNSIVNGGSSIIISHNVFRSESDIDYILDQLAIRMRETGATV